MSITNQNELIMIYGQPKIRLAVHSENKCDICITNNIICDHGQDLTFAKHISYFPTAVQYSRAFFTINSHDLVHAIYVLRL